MNDGRIVTCFSVRGGVGRTMILADLAWILANNGMRVIAIDWNFEAPGLSVYFRPFLPADCASRPGVIDLLWDYVLDGTRSGPSSAADSQFSAHAQSLNWEFPYGGTLDFVSPGRKAPFRTRTALFPWQPFMDRYGGTAFIAAIRDWLRTRYDYALIDARTGVLDALGICTVHLPDVLVCPFSMVGANPSELQAVLSHIIDQRAEQPPRMLPVPTGVQLAEQALLMRMRDYTRTVFGGMLELDSRYWDSVEVPYQLLYAYKKVPSVFADHGGGWSVLSAMEALAKRVTDGRVTGLPEIDEQTRTKALDAYENLPEPVSMVPPQLPAPFEGAGDYFFVSYKREDFDRLVLTLAQATELGYRLWWDAGIVGGDEWERRLQERISSGLGVLLFISEQALHSTEIRKEIELAHSLKKPIVPVRLDATVSIGALEDLVGRLQFVEDPRGLPSHALEHALRFALQRH